MLALEKELKYATDDRGRRRVGGSGGSSGGPFDLDLLA